MNARSGVQPQMSGKHADMNARGFIYVKVEVELCMSGSSQLFM